VPTGRLADKTPVVRIFGTPCRQHHTTETVVVVTIRGMIVVAIRRPQIHLVVVVPPRNTRLVSPVSPDRGSVSSSFSETGFLRLKWLKTFIFQKKIPFRFAEKSKTFSMMKKKVKEKEVIFT